jgi:hypothetical protein
LSVLLAEQLLSVSGQTSYTADLTVPIRRQGAVLMAGVAAVADLSRTNPVWAVVAFGSCPINVARQTMEVVKGG